MAHVKIDTIVCLSTPHMYLKMQGVDGKPLAIRGPRDAMPVRPEELAAGEVSLKPLRAADAQVRIAPTRVAGIIQQSV